MSDIEKKIEEEEEPEYPEMVEDFISCFKKSPKFKYFHVDPIDFGWFKVRNIILVDLPRKTLDSLMGGRFNYGMMRFSMQVHGGYLLEAGDDEPELYLVYSTRL